MCQVLAQRGEVGRFTVADRQLHACVRGGLVGPALNRGGRVVGQVDLFVVLDHLFFGANPDSEWLHAVKVGLLQLEEQGITVLLYRRHTDEGGEQGVDGLERYYVSQNGTAPIELTVGAETVNLHLLHLPLSSETTPSSTIPCESLVSYHIGILLMAVSGANCSNPHYDFLIHHKESIQ